MGSRIRTLESIMILTLLLSSSLSVSAQGPPDHSLCLDPVMMSAVCSFNTDIGRKMESAHIKCNQDEEEPTTEAPIFQPLPMAVTRRRRCKNGRCKKRRCGKVDLDVLSQFFGTVWTRKACILKEVGWVNEEDVILPDAIMADISTLPPVLSSGLTDTKDVCMERAANMTVKTMFESPEFAMEEMDDDQNVVAQQAEKCKLKNLDQEKLGEIEKYLKKLAFVTCVNENFMTGCGNFILGNVQDMLAKMVQEAQQSQETTVVS